MRFELRRDRRKEWEELLLKDDEGTLVAKCLEANLNYRTHQRILHHAPVNSSTLQTVISAIPEPIRREYSNVGTYFFERIGGKE